MAGPLDGIRIIDLSERVSGPLGVMVLADQGADVIKVEPPKHGEGNRELSNYRNGMAALYANCNHGKRSIGIDLKTDEGLTLFYQLVREADVVAQNWRPGTAERLRVGEADLREIKPDLIYASINGFGDDGGASKTVIEMGKTKDNEWELKLSPPFSVFQAFGMAVAAITAT